MRLLIIGLSALLLVAADTSAAGTMCATGDRCCAADAACCKASPCCSQASGKAVARIDGRELPIFPPGSEWQEPSERPVREYARVEFRDPVKVGDKILFGTYVIEHDTERMARGGPCTHIYKFNDRRLPVVAFHCRHLNREKHEQASVTLRRLPDPSTKLYELVEFQFENDGDAHGVPGIR